MHIFLINGVVTWLGWFDQPTQKNFNPCFFRKLSKSKVGPSIKTKSVAVLIARLITLASFKKDRSEIVPTSFVMFVASVFYHRDLKS